MMALMYDMIMSVPDMVETTVKVDLRISRQGILLLSNVVEMVLDEKGNEKDGGVLSVVPEDAREELRTFIRDCLEKSGLSKLNEKMKSLAKV